MGGAESPRTRRRTFRAPPYLETLRRRGASPRCCFSASRPGCGAAEGDEGGEVPRGEAGRLQTCERSTPTHAGDTRRSAVLTGTRGRRRALFTEKGTYLVVDVADVDGSFTS